MRKMRFHYEQGFQNGRPYTVCTNPAFQGGRIRVRIAGRQTARYIGRSVSFLFLKVGSLTLSPYQAKDAVYIDQPLFTCYIRDVVPGTGNAKRRKKEGEKRGEWKSST